MRSLSILLLLAGPAAAQETLAGRTHAFVMPSGETVPRGEASFQVHALSLWNQVLYGVTDRIELSVAAPSAPAFGTAGARVSLTQRESTMRLVLGAGVGVPLLAADDASGVLYWGSLTA